MFARALSALCRHPRHRSKQTVVDGPEIQNRKLFIRQNGSLDIKTFVAKELKSIDRGVPIILYSRERPTNLQNIDVYLEKGGSTRLLPVVRRVVQRFLP